MRLLHRTATGFDFKEFDDARDVRYAILSHRWHGSDEEITYKDIKKKRSLDTKLRGLQKLTYTLEQASEDGLDYVWIDTCCIDKSSSTELSEAINSMYYWYQQAEKCYAFLWDVTPECPILDDYTSQGHWLEQFGRSEWFTRGWTLQELIAPHEVFFYGRHWNFLGTSSKLVRTIAEYSNIHADVLSGVRSLDSFSIAQRMSWAAYRTTSRIEDQAYCLLGIFGVNMPMLYGERERAFTRLQEEIIRSTTDQSIFAWRATSPACEYLSDVSSLLAKSPTDFRHGDIIHHEGNFQDRSTVQITQRGFDATLPLVEYPDRLFYAVLNCTARELDTTNRVALRIRPLPTSSQDAPYVVAPSQDPADLGRLGLLDDHRPGALDKYQTITILKDIYARDKDPSVSATGHGARPAWLNLGMLDDSRIETLSVQVLLSHSNLSGASSAPKSGKLSPHKALRAAVTGDGNLCIQIKADRGVHVSAIVTLGRAHLLSSTGLFPYEAQLSLTSPHRYVAVFGPRTVRRYLWPIEMTHPVEYRGGILRARLSVPGTVDRQGAWLEFGVYG